MTAAASSLRLVVAVLAGAVAAAALTGDGMNQEALATAPLHELWQDPGNIADRDLLWGRGGKAQAPLPDADFEFLAIDAVGHSAGYQVVDPSGRQWDVKTGDESQPEVVASRVLWAIGYHQPIVYFMPEWKLKNGPVPAPLPGRFRLGSDHATVGDWSWTDNPFRGTRQLKGLVLANLLINNWDLKTSNNKVLSVPTAMGSLRWFVAQDVGASFGKTAWPIGNRNSVDDYETQRFVLGVQDGRVQFDYQARHRELLEDITPDDVVWTARLFARITDQQWHDAFRASHMPDGVSARYIRKIKSKIEEGLSLSTHTVDQ